MAVHCEDGTVTDLRIGMVEGMKRRYIGHLIRSCNRNLGILPYRKQRIFPSVKVYPRR